MTHEESFVTTPPSAGPDHPARPAGSGPRNKRVPPPPGVRFPAALLVFVYHSSLLIPTIAVFGYTALGAHYATIAANAGALGVSFFFVLSGFVLTWTPARPNRAHDTPRAFWRRRFVKIYPNYVVA